MTWNIRINHSAIGLLRRVNSQICSVLPIVLTIVVLALALRLFYLVFRGFTIDKFWDIDFFAIWSFAKFALTNRVSEIYDNSVLLDFQMDLGDVPAERAYPYPPSFLLMILPLGFMAFPLAFAIWNVFTLAFYCVASFYRRWRLSAIFLTIFAPAALQNLTTGQTGFLSAALILGGFRLVKTRPILSGTLFGLASFKPQLGILIPIALISTRSWRPLVAAVVTIAVLVVASSVAFGWSMWSIWLAKLPAHADWALDVPNRLKPTITANLTLLGVDLAVARIVQIFVAVFVAIGIWVCFRRGITLLATAALLVGTFLATPYAFDYDMPMLTNAVLMLILHKDQTNRFLTIPEALVLLLVLVLPEIMLETWRPSMFKTVPLILLLGLIVRDLFRFGSDVAQQGSAPAAKAIRAF
jgi:hypothetical protein